MAGCNKKETERGERGGEGDSESHRHAQEKLFSPVRKASSTLGHVVGSAEKRKRLGSERWN